MTARRVSPDHTSCSRDSFESKLVEGLWNPLPDVAETCAWSLGRLRVKAAVPDLCDVIRERTDLDAVRAAAIRALGEIGDCDALPTLLAVARNGHVTVRLAAIETLERLDLDTSLTKDIGEIARTEPSDRLRAKAEEILRRVNDSHKVEENDAN